MNPCTIEHVRSFLSELRELCEKHRVGIGFGDLYVGYEQFCHLHADHTMATCCYGDPHRQIRVDTLTLDKRHSLHELDEPAPESAAKPDAKAAGRQTGLQSVRKFRPMRDIIRDIASARPASSR